MIQVNTFASGAELRAAFENAGIDLERHAERVAERLGVATGTLRQNLKPSKTNITESLAKKTTEMLAEVIPDFRRLIRKSTASYCEESIFRSTTKICH